MQGNKMKIMKYILPLAVAFIAGCGGPAGSGFEGKWVQKDNQKPSSLVLHKDGEIYHVDFTYNSQQLDEYHTKKMEAKVVSDSVLEVVGSMGSVTFRLQDNHIYFQDGEYVKSN
jgi:hypothetical protein